MTFIIVQDLTDVIVIALAKAALVLMYIWTYSLHRSSAGQAIESKGIVKACVHQSLASTKLYCLVIKKTVIDWLICYSLCCVIVEWN